jgi:hypothetical protein
MVTRPAFRTPYPGKEGKSDRRALEPDKTRGDDACRFLRHCEERSDEAIQLRAKRAKKARQSQPSPRFIGAPAGPQLDCFASLAMTRWRTPGCLTTE